MLLSSSAREECMNIGARTTQRHTSNSADTESYDAVVVGLAPSLLDYEHLNTAFRILVGENNRAKETEPASVPKPLLIALHKARYIQAPDNALSLGPGPFVSALEEAAQTRALVVGKPTKLFFETVIKSFGNEITGSVGEGNNDIHGHIAVIGDDVSADLGEGAIDLGLWRVLGEPPVLFQSSVPFCLARFWSVLFAHRLLHYMIRNDVRPRLFCNAVKTGKYRQGDEKRRGIQSPDEICDSFANFVDRLLCQGEKITRLEHSAE